MDPFRCFMFLDCCGEAAALSRLFGKILFAGENLELMVHGHHSAPLVFEILRFIRLKENDEEPARALKWR